MIKVKHQLSGYSLIELTIVVGLVSILSITISAIVLSTIVNGNRIKTQIRLRQSGDYAIGQINTLIRNSRAVIACDSTTDTLTIKNQDALETTIQKATSVDTAQIASNSAYLTPTDTNISAFDLTCLPSDLETRLVKINFTLEKADTTTGKTTENPTESFSTSAEIRNY